MSVTLRKKPLDSGHFSLYLDITGGKKRERKFLNLVLTGNRIEDRETMKRADAIRALKERELLDQKHGAITNPNPGAVNFFEFASDVLKSKGDSMAQSLKSAIDRFREVVGDEATFSTITRADMERFRDYLLAQDNLSNNTGNMYLARVRAIFRAAVRRDIITRIPGEEVTIKPEERSTTYLELEELKALASTPCEYPHIRNGFIFCCMCGLRWSDVHRLTWPMIHNGNMTIRIQKSRKPERLPLSVEARSILELQRTVPRGIVKRNDPDSVFNLPAESRANRILKIWAKAAKIDKRLTWHVSRHTFATLALSATGDLYTVSKLLTHSSIRTTQRYAKVIDATKQAAIDKMPTLTEGAK